MRRVSLTILASLLALAVPAYPQNITGSMSGRVVDQQRAVVGMETNKRVSTVLERVNIPLSAQDKLALGDLSLTVGVVTETVEISATAAMLQTESVERSEAIVGKQIDNIEVNGRNPLDMAKLIPGVFSVANVAVGGVGGLSSVYVNGNRGTMNQLTINGIGDIDTGADGSQNVTVSTDSIAEFKVLTGQYQAEYGRNAGGQIAMVTKGGTDQLHGSADAFNIFHHANFTGENMTLNFNAYPTNANAASTSPASAR
jgi:outer membrane receptor protein involved in Fe transport